VNRLKQEFVKASKSQHDLKTFDCGKPEMNQFLARFASKNMSLGLSSTWVLPVDEGENDKLPIASYYTLSMATVHREQIPTKEKLPGYPVPVILVARLAVDKCFQGTGLGSKSLVYALRHCHRISGQNLPALGVILDVLDQDALSFYEGFEIFEPFIDNPMRLFVSMRTLEQL
jgi:GNAT superfamily N-acetyltransferase